MPIRALRFNLVSLLALSVSYSVFILLSAATSIHPVLAQAIGIVPATVINYLLNVY